MKHLTVYKLPCLLMLFCILAVQSFSQVINKVEYFVDNDPGFGLATNVSVTAGADISALVIPTDITAVTPGIHNLYIRSRNDGGIWSLTNRFLFFKEALSSNINKLEYFVDTDPGFGSATNVSITAGADISGLIVSTDLTSVAPGIHNLYIRTRDDAGKWSLSNRSQFFKQTLSSTVNKLEYFVDTDPGFGSATNVPITAGADINGLVVPTDLTTVPAGIHKLYIRTRDNTGNWSLTNNSLFFKNAFSANINKLEYFMDTDPGFGNATNIPVTPGADISGLVVPININSLSIGMHNMYVRSRDDLGNWSITNRFLFYKNQAQANMQRGEYFIDIDPGFGNGMAIPFGGPLGTDVAGFSFGSDITSVCAGLHKMYVRTQDLNGLWSLTNVFQFTKIANAPVITAASGSAGAGAGCEGTLITITGTDLNCATSVTVGGTPVSILTDTTTQITAILSTGTTGNIVVNTAGGESNGFAFTVIPNNTIMLSSAAGTNAQVKCINTPITAVTYNTTTATGATFSGLPPGVTGAWSANVVTISGSPNTVTGSPFSYTVTLIGGCTGGVNTATGTITVTPDNTILLSSAAGTNAQTKCINTAITNITYTTTGATGATFSGLPAGVTGSFVSNTVTINGTPSVAGLATYTVTLTGGCGVKAATGSITVNANANAGAITGASPICNGVTTNYITTGGDAGGTWSSSNPAVATVNVAGIVSAISAGTANIIYTVTGCGSNLTAAQSITVNPSSLPTIAKTVTQPTGANNNYFEVGCELLSKIVPGGLGPISGNVTSKVWVETSVPHVGTNTSVNPFVARHYEITPTAGSTATVTLYFTQQEFDNFNAEPGSTLKLPVNGSDASGKAHLNIGKYSGSSSDGSGLPSSYSMGTTIIDPSDGNIIYNPSFSRWEVTFDVNGFSGFIVQTSTVVLPVRIVSFAGRLNEDNSSTLYWDVAEQLNIAKYTVQKSTDGINYTEIGVVNANNLSSFRYTYTDPLAGSGLIYYRLKITDNNGRVALSSIVSLTVKVNGSMVIFPNPVTDFFTVQITGAFTKQEARIYDTKGRLLKTVLIATSTQKINVSEFARGIYLIKFSDSSVYKISKQ